MTPWRGGEGIAVRVLAATLGAATLGAALLTAAPAAAQDNSDAQVWVQALALGRIGEDWRTHVEVQPRLLNDGSELGLTIVRTAIGRSLAPRVTVWLGHAWVPRTLGAGVRHEQRIWQQLSLTSPTVAGWSPSGRLRVEQRWLEPWAGMSHRVRLMARAQRALATGRPWGVFAYDEAMFTLDRTTRGPARGYDRNRLSAGVAYRFGPVFSTDLGYVWEHSPIPGDGHRNDHVLLVALNVTAPR